MKKILSQNAHTTSNKNQFMVRFVLVMNGTQNSRDRETLPSIGNEETKVSQILESDLERDTLVDEITPDMTAPGRLERRRFRTISVEEYLKHISEDSEYNLRLSKVGL